MSEKVTYRDARMEDLPVIVDIYNSTIPGRMVTADTDPVSVESKLEWFNDHSPRKHPLWVMEWEGQICGWISFQAFYGRPAYQATAEVSIYLHEDFRGKGIGKQALKKAMETSPSLGIETLLGFIFGHNQPSIRLFSAYGFEQWAFLPEVAELDGVKRNVVIMGKKVSHMVSED